MPRHDTVLPTLAGRAALLIHHQDGEGGLASSDAVVGKVIEDVPHLVSQGDSADTKGLSKLSVSDDGAAHRSHNERSAGLPNDVCAVLPCHVPKMPYLRPDRVTYACTA